MGGLGEPGSRLSVGEGPNNPAPCPRHDDSIRQQGLKRLSAVQPPCSPNHCVSYTLHAPISEAKPRNAGRAEDLHDSSWFVDVPEYAGGYLSHLKFLDFCSWSRIMDNELCLNFSV